MNLYINSPSHYTQEYGVIDEIYQLCQTISQSIDITIYTECIDTIGIVPMIAPLDILNKTGWKEQKYISLTYRMASVSLISDYNTFCHGNMEDKKNIILENILRSLKEIKKKLKGNFNYLQLEQDIKEIVTLFESRDL